MTTATLPATYKEILGAELEALKNAGLYKEERFIHAPQGTEIDLVVEGLNSTLKFRNPNAQMECGCGESFGV